MDKPRAHYFKNNLPLRNLVGLSGNNLFIPLYHSLKNESPLPHIDNLYQVRTVETFTKDLEYLNKHFSPVTLEEIIQNVKQNKSFEQPSFHITFDDGLKEFYMDAAPILMENNIPATCFINNDFVDNKGLFYKYKISLIIQKIKEKDYPKGIEKYNLEDPENLIKKLRAYNFNDAEKIDEIACDLNVDFDSFLNSYEPYLKTEQINELIKQGFTFGAHSAKHKEYQQMDELEQIENTKKSVHNLCADFGLNYKAFAFPFTDHKVKGSYFDAMKNELDVSFGTAGLKKKEYGSHLHRIPMEKGNLSMEGIIKAEYLYYLLKAPFGKNSIQRK